MIIKDSHGHYFLLAKVMLFMLLRNLLNSFKTRKILTLYPLGVIMEENLKINILNYFVMKMILSIMFLHLEPLNKMELLRGKIGL